LEFTKTQILLKKTHFINQKIVGLPYLRLLFFFENDDLALFRLLLENLFLFLGEDFPCPCPLFNGSVEAFGSGSKPSIISVGILIPTNFSIDVK